MLTLRVCRPGWRPWHVQTRGCWYWWEMSPSGNLSFQKTTLVGWMSGSWTQRVEIAFAEGFCALGGNFGWGRPWLGRRAAPLFQLYPGLCLITEEKHGKPQSAHVYIPFAWRWFGASTPNAPGQHGGNCLPSTAPLLIQSTTKIGTKYKIILNLYKY
jgi:hypothetical protein